MAADVDPVDFRYKISICSCRDRESGALTGKHICDACGAPDNISIERTGCGQSVARASSGNGRRDLIFKSIAEWSCREICWGNSRVTSSSSSSSSSSSRLLLSGTTKREDRVGREWHRERVQSHRNNDKQVMIAKLTNVPVGHPDIGAW